MDLAFLKGLSEAVGTPGREEAVRHLLRRRLEPVVDDMQVDALGNLLVRKGSGPVRVLLDAHMDEVGGLVADVTDDGYLRFKVSGSVDERLWPGRHVWVGPERQPGVVGLGAYHLVRGDTGGRDRAVPQRDLFIDIGAGTRAEALALVDYGDPVVWSTTFTELGGGIVSGKAFDDRAGCAAVATLLSGPAYDRITLIGSFSVQEEVGLRGARVAAYQAEPNVALALEATVAGDVPDVDASRRSTAMGQGPALTWLDGQTIVPAGLLRHLENLAVRQGIAYQHRRLTQAGTDAGAIHQVRSGVPTAVISVPCRYIHSPVALMNLQDLTGMVALAQAFLTSIEKGEYQP